MPDRDQLELSVTRHDRRSESRRVMEELRRDAQRIARRFGLSYKAIRAERTEVTEHYGVCYADGEIRIRLRHATTGRVLKYSSLIDTLCHELAHLKHFDHSERFYEFFEEMLEWSREQGIYAPGPMGRTEPSAPQPEPIERGIPQELQLPLFGGAAVREALKKGGSGEPER
ncbi:MAG: M48 family metallopeptidase [Myxococcales bacterium]|nr:M48 family metallopeptidase [Myxococcales bacterium]